MRTSLNLSSACPRYSFQKLGYLQVEKALCCQNNWYPNDLGYYCVEFQKDVDILWDMEKYSILLFGPRALLGWFQSGRKGLGRIKSEERSLIPTVL